MVVWISAGEQTVLTVAVRPLTKDWSLQAQAMSVTAQPVAPRAVRPGWRAQAGRLAMVTV